MIIQLLFGFLSFILSPFGILSILLGLVGFLALPLVPAVTGRFHSLANLHGWLAAMALGRVGFLLSEHGDLLVKSMQFSDLGVEEMNLSGETKEFDDPDSALHSWFGVPFALADEVHGVLFDQRHAVLGEIRNDLTERGEMSIQATDAEWQKWSIHQWKRGVFELPSNAYRFARLGAVRHIVDGGERAEFPARVEAMYENSRAPFDGGGQTVKYVMILAALLGPFSLMWVLATQGGGGGSSSTVGYGLLFLLASVPISREQAVVGGSSLLGLGLLAALVVVAGPLVTVFSIVCFSVGFLFVPVLTMLSRVSLRLSESIARLLLRLMFVAYDRPVMTLTPEGQHFREYSDLDATTDVVWYSLLGATIGFALEPTEDLWGPEVMDRERLKTNELVADGGSPDETNVPEHCQRMPSMRRASLYAGYGPKRVDDNTIYLNSGIALSRFEDSAVGHKSYQKLQWAKDEYGESNGMSDKTVLMAMLGSGVVSMALGVFVFFL